MIVMQLSQRSDGTDVAACGPFSVATRHGATMALARKLITAGEPDGPWQAVGADGRVRLQGPSLHRLAQWTMSEPDGGGLRRVPYRENTRFPVRGDSPDGFSEPDAAEQPPG